MRTLFLAVFSLMLTTISKASPNDCSLNGFWYNARMDQAIRIKENPHSLIINWLDDHYGNERYERVDRGLFVDDFGNKIIVDRSNVLVFIPRKKHRHQKWVFERMDDSTYDHHNRHGDRYGKYGEDNHRKYKDKNDRDRGRYEDDYGHYNDNNNKQWDNEKWDNNRYEQMVTGTWKVDRDGRLVAIVDTRDGLKAKFSGSNTWVSYVQLQDDKNVFKDENGNEYHFSNNGRAQWLSSRKGDKSIELTKISDEVNY